VTQAAINTKPRVLLALENTTNLVKTQTSESTTKWRVQSHKAWT